ncbi:MAG TPA: condensation domain-containing protein, partial [Chitinophaga sp.]|uniref:condensation domain-containing protein n=1 Tax=Chitinophaga sp. TaxID=1869181 RepID=UPI002BF8DC76
MNTLEIIAAFKKYKVVPVWENNQLKLVGDTASLPGAFIEEIRNNKQELIAFLSRTMDQTANAPIPLVPAQEHYPASNAQRRLWVLSQFDGGTSAYNILKNFYLKGRVVRENLNRAFRLAVQRHESLRTVFREIDGELRQVVLPAMQFDIDFEDISAVADKKVYLKTWASASVAWKFDLANGPLIKVVLLRIADDEYAMIFGMHHIVSDGWSIGVLVKEVMHCYEALCLGKENSMPPVRVQYKDYAHWLDQRIEGSRGTHPRDFWMEQFTNMTDPLNLPTDIPRPGMKSFEGAVSRFQLEPDVYNSILAFCKTNQVTLFNFFRSALTVLLSKFSGQHDITMGTPVSGRNHFELEGQIGLYVNTLPLRIAINHNDTFSELLRNISENSYRSFEFQDYPLDKIIDNLHLKRDTSRSPLFDVMMVLQNTAVGDGSINLTRQHGFDLHPLDDYLYPAGRTSDEALPAKFDLTFNFYNEPDNKFFVEIEYATTLFRKESINRFFRAFQRIIAQVLQNPGIRTGNIDILDAAEREEILYRFNRPVGEVAAISIPSLLEARLQSMGDAPAIICGDVVVSYNELRDRSDRIASCLTTVAGLQPG